MHVYITPLFRGANLFSSVEHSNLSHRLHSLNSHPGPHLQTQICVCTCVCVCARACVCVCVFVRALVRLNHTLETAVLDPIFIFTLGMGASGAAAGTAIAQYIALVPLLQRLDR
jgi:hypothetical protein